MRTWFLALLVLAGLPTGLGRAQQTARPVASPPSAEDMPVVVVIEASGTRYDAARIRHLISDSLDLPVITILEAAGRPAHGTLAVAVTERGRRAAISYLPSDGTRFAVMIEVSATSATDLYGEWLVAPCVSAVRTSAERRYASTGPNEVVDPWLSSHQQTGTREVIDPWVGTPRRRVRVSLIDYHLGDEIIDPWAAAVSEYHEEQAERLSRPTPRGRRVRGHR